MLIYNGLFSKFNDSLQLSARTENGLCYNLNVVCSLFPSEQGFFLCYTHIRHRVLLPVNHHNMNKFTSIQVKCLTSKRKKIYVSSFVCSKRIKFNYLKPSGTCAHHKYIGNKRKKILLCCWCVLNLSSI